MLVYELMYSTTSFSKLTRLNVFLISYPNKDFQELVAYQRLVSTFLIFFFIFRVLVEGRFEYLIKLFQRKVVICNICHFTDFQVFLSRELGRTPTLSYGAHTNFFELTEIILEHLLHIL